MQHVATVPDPQPQRLWTRYEHGNLPVDVIEDEGARRLTMHMPDGGRFEFSSTRSFMRHLYRGKSATMPFTRYFRLDEEPTIEVAGFEDVLAFCNPMGFGFPDVMVRRRLGIDLGAPGHNPKCKTVAEDVRRILYGRFGHKIKRLGYEAEEVLSEVYRKILVSNQGEHPYNPEVSSFGHYVYMVCNSALLNFRKKVERRRKRETTGIAIFEESHRVIVDAGDALASNSRIHTSGRLVLDNDPAERLRLDWSVRSLVSRIDGDQEIHELSRRIVTLMAEGYRGRELATQVGMTPSTKRYKEAMRFVQEIAGEWAREEGLPLFGD